MALAASPAIGEALSPSIANLMEYLRPFQKHPMPQALDPYLQKIINASRSDRSFLE